MSPLPPYLLSGDVLDDFVSQWERTVLPKAEWTHSAHIAVGAYYVVRYGASAFDQMKTGLLRYAAAVGIHNTDTSGYHETLTRLWIEILARTVGTYSDPLEAARFAVLTFGDFRDLPRLYYSFDVTLSIAARRAWVPPDLSGPY